MKVYEFAKSVNKTSKEVLNYLKSKGVVIKSHLSKLDDASLELLKKWKSEFTRESQEGASTLSEKSASQKTEKKPVDKVKKKKTPKKADKLEKSEDSGSKIEPAGKKIKKKKEPVLESKSQSSSKRDIVQKCPEYLQLKFPVTVGSLATNLMVKTSDVIKTLMGMGVFATVNQLISEDVAVKVAEKFNVLLERLPNEEEQIILEHGKEDDESALVPRPPIVTMMGHVDHGKTSLLDAIRKSNVAAREAGKITQHIGSYAVNIPEKGIISFLDTPGHAAFTSMRARGANLTDIVVIVVAADDSVMPQTVEAIDHAKAAGTPIIVAINKIDLPSANPDKVKADLQKYDLIPEEWGGKTVMVNVSAKTGEGVGDLLEMILLEAELLELKANPNRKAQGVVVEAKLSKGLGPVSVVLVQNGTLHIGDYVVCDEFYGRIKAIHDDRGKRVKEAGPSIPVEIVGLNGVPVSGEKFFVVENEKQVKSVAEKRAIEKKEKNLSAKNKHLSLESLYDMMKKQGTKELKIIVKADVQGSVEVLRDSLEKLSNDKIKLNVIHGGVGGVNESDVMLAVASDAVIIGFHVKADAKAQVLIDKERVDMKYYRVIYEAINDVKLAMEGMLEPTYEEVVLGIAEVQQTFKASKIGTIAGCIVRKGKIVRSGMMRLIRDNVVIYEGKVASLKRFKDDVKEVSEGYECGLVLESYSDIKAGDIFECYKEVEKATKL